MATVVSNLVSTPKSPSVSSNGKAKPSTKGTSNTEKEVALERIADRILKKFEHTATSVKAHINRGSGKDITLLIQGVSIDREDKKEIARVKREIKKATKADRVTFKNGQEINKRNVHYTPENLIKIQEAINSYLKSYPLSRGYVVLKKVADANEQTVAHATPEIILLIDEKDIPKITQRQSLDEELGELTSKLVFETGLHVTVKQKGEIEEVLKEYGAPTYDKRYLGGFGLPNTRIITHDLLNPNGKKAILIELQIDRKDTLSLRYKDYDPDELKTLISKAIEIPEIYISIKEEQVVNLNGKSKSQLTIIIQGKKLEEGEIQPSAIRERCILELAPDLQVVSDLVAKVTSPSDKEKVAGLLATLRRKFASQEIKLSLQEGKITLRSNYLSTNLQVHNFLKEVAVKLVQSILPENYLVNYEVQNRL